MTRVLIYARVSTEEQTRHDYSSLDMQEDAARKHVAHMAAVAGVPAPPIAVYREEGVSGKTLNRPALKQVQAEIERGGVSAVVVYKLDRLTRSLHHFLDLDAQFQAHGTGIVSVREQLDTTTPMGRALRSLLLIFAELERETIVQRVRDKHTALMEAGRYTGGAAPYGFTGQRGAGLTLDPEQVKVIVRIFDEYGRQGLSTVDIARRLNAEGVPSPRSGAWQARAIRRIVGAPHYRGIQIYGPRVGAWPYEPFVPPELVEAAVRRLENTRHTRGRNKVLWEWQGVLSCSGCGWRLSRNTTRKTLSDGTVKIYEQYRCSYQHSAQEQGRAPCNIHWVVPRHTAALTEALLAAVSGSQPAPAAEPDPSVARRLAEIEERRRRARIAFLDPSVGFLTEAQYRTVMRECDQEEEALTPPAVSVPSGLTLLDAWPGLSTQERNTAIRLLADRADVYVGRVEIVTRPTGWLNWPPKIVVPLLGP